MDGSRMESDPDRSLYSTDESSQESDHQDRDREDQNAVPLAQAPNFLSELVDYRAYMMQNRNLEMNPNDDEFVGNVPMILNFFDDDDDGMIFQPQNEIRAVIERAEEDDEEQFPQELWEEEPMEEVEFQELVDAQQNFAA